MVLGYCEVGFVDVVVVWCCGDCVVVCVWIRLGVEGYGDVG